MNCTEKPESVETLPDIIPLTEQEKNEVTTLEMEVVKLKSKLADAAIFLQRLSVQAVAAEDRYKARVLRAAQAHGIDVTNPTGNKWDYDMDTKIFSKSSQSA